MQTQQPGDADADADADHEFLIMSVPDLVQLGCRGCAVDGECLHQFRANSPSDAQHHRQ